ncbi:MAG: MFS transporter [Alphaproteobacteria bacterium]|nr:MFS transporter [Alphaproteobacteria bacterium]MBU1516394.1 MFS transporter [Alphaproteobacteria bacterium]MBU2093369.1 MFS transporter [Alphaproteobacteria bacterium]MBU2153856.1 MFS transporter [Alphaproteobacteria bacterium]MBU2307728.1 MFS transporter [Alphaproteobacteria bacterium]
MTIQTRAARPGRSAGASLGEADWPNPTYAWCVVGLLMLAFTSSFIDRQILTLLVGPIRADLGITDTQFSLLVGLAFSLFYAFWGLPLAYAADRYSRRWIIAIGVFVWSVMTIASGLADSYWHLFLARMGVGIGEATLTPAAASLIADYFSRERRGRAMAVYATGVYWGSGLALLTGGAVLNLIAAMPSLSSSAFAGFEPWQIVFFLVGAPGFVIAGLMLLIREPVRRGAVGPVDGVGQARPKLAPFLRENARTILTMFLGFSFLGVVVIGYLTWIPAIFMRKFAWTAEDVGFAFGLIVMLFGTGGILAGGWLSDRLIKAGRTDAPMRAGLYGGIATIPFAIAAPLMPTGELVLAVAAIALFLATSTQALPVIAIQLMSPNALRARLASIYFLFGSILIFTAGPSIVAAVTDFVFRDDQAVSKSLAIVCAVAAPLGVACLAVGLQSYRTTVARVAEWEIQT